MPDEYLYSPVKGYKIFVSNGASAIHFHPLGDDRRRIRSRGKRAGEGEKQGAGLCRLTARTLDYHLVLPVFVPLVLLVLVATATVRRAVFLVLSNVRHVRVDTFGVQGWQGPREWGRFEVRDGRVPGAGIMRPFGLATFGGQLLDCLQKRKRRSLW